VCVCVCVCVCGCVCRCMCLFWILCALFASWYDATKVYAEVRTCVCRCVFFLVCARYLPKLHTCVYYVYVYVCVCLSLCTLYGNCAEYVIHCVFYSVRHFLSRLHVLYNMCF